MVQQESRLKVADNTGAKSFNYPCFRRYQKKVCPVGDKIVVSIKDTSTEALKGAVSTAVVPKKRSEKSRWFIH
jgi:large subunit ribosomal protein L14